MAAWVSLDWRGIVVGGLGSPGAAHTRQVYSREERKQGERRRRKRQTGKCVLFIDVGSGSDELLDFLEVSLGGGLFHGGDGGGGEERVGARGEKKSLGWRRKEVLVAVARKREEERRKKKRKRREKREVVFWLFLCFLFGEREANLGSAWRTASKPRLGKRGAGHASESVVTLETALTHRFKQTGALLVCYLKPDPGQRQTVRS